MWQRIKELISLIVGTRLELTSRGRTYVNVPMWLVALLAVSSMKLAALSVVLVIAFGLSVRVLRR